MLRPSISVPIFGISLLLISSSLSANETEKENDNGETAKLNEANLEKVEAKVTKREAKETKGAEKAKKKLKKPKGGARETRDVFVAAEGVGEGKTQKVANKDENGPSPPISSPNRRFKRGKMLRYAAAGGIVGLGLGLAAGK